MLVSSACMAAISSGCAGVASLLTRVPMNMPKIRRAALHATAPSGERSHAKKLHRAARSLESLTFGVAILGENACLEGPVLTSMLRLLAREAALQIVRQKFGDLFAVHCNLLVGVGLVGAGLVGVAESAGARR